ncbi:MAG TPA: bifunctional nuclease family protein [Thermomicrobiales bacterium]|nr:bifunctional nuclease family protein [Thermomicrobiales bacterium]
MIEATVESIRVSLITQHRVVILKELEGDRHLPIWIGAYEAEAIAMELQGISATRPLPYDLMQTMLGDLGATVDRVVIADLNDQVYFARIVLDQAGRSIDVDSRPSDAIALAVRVGCRILVDEAIMERAGVAVEDDDLDIDATLAPSSGIVDAETASEPSIPDAIAPTAESSAPRVDDEQLSVFRDFINSLDLDDFDRRRSN